MHNTIKRNLAEVQGHKTHGCILSQTSRHRRTKAYNPSNADNYSVRHIDTIDSSFFSEQINAD